MKNLFSVLTLALAISLTSCQNGQQPAQEEAAADTAQTELLVDSLLTPEKLMAEGKNLIDQTVEIQGEIAHVCSHGGKKCNIVGENAELSIQIMAGGEIEKFTADMIGSEIRAKGTVKERRITKDIVAKQEAAIEAKKQNAKTEEEQKICSHSMHSVNTMKTWMEENQLDYYPVYYIEGTSFEFVED